MNNIIVACFLLTHSVVLYGLIRCVNLWRITNLVFFLFYVYLFVCLLIAMFIYGSKIDVDAFETSFVAP